MMHTTHTIPYRTSDDSDDDETMQRAIESSQRLAQQRQRHGSPNPKAATNGPGLGAGAGYAAHNGVSVNGSSHTPSVNISGITSPFRSNSATDVDGPSTPKNGTSSVSGSQPGSARIAAADRSATPPMVPAAAVASGVPGSAAAAGSAAFPHHGHGGGQGFHHPQTHGVPPHLQSPHRKPLPGSTPPRSTSPQIGATGYVVSTPPRSASPHVLGANGVVTAAGLGNPNDASVGLGGGTTAAGGGIFSAQQMKAAQANVERQRQAAVLSQRLQQQGAGAGAANSTSIGRSQSPLAPLAPAVRSLSPAAHQVTGAGTAASSSVPTMPVSPSNGVNVNGAGIGSRSPGYLGHGSSPPSASTTRAAPAAPVGDHDGFAPGQSPFDPDGRQRPASVSPGHSPSTSTANHNNHHHAGNLQTGSDAQHQMASLSPDSRDMTVSPIRASTAALSALSPDRMHAVHARESVRESAGLLSSATTDGGSGAPTRETSLAQPHDDAHPQQQVNSSASASAVVVAGGGANVEAPSREESPNPVPVPEAAATSGRSGASAGAGGGAAPRGTDSHGEPSVSLEVVRMSTDTVQTTATVEQHRDPPRPLTRGPYGSVSGSNFYGGIHRAAQQALEEEEREKQRVERAAAERAQKVHHPSSNRDDAASRATDDGQEHQEENGDGLCISIATAPMSSAQPTPSAAASAAAAAVFRTVSALTADPADTEAEIAAHVNTDEGEENAAEGGGLLPLTPENISALEQASTEPTVAPLVIETAPIVPEQEVVHDSQAEPKINAAVLSEDQQSPATTPSAPSTAGAAVTVSASQPQPQPTTTATTGVGGVTAIPAPVLTHPTSTTPNATAAIVLTTHGTNSSGNAAFDGTADVAVPHSVSVSPVSSAACTDDDDDAAESLRLAANTAAALAAAAAGTTGASAARTSGGTSMLLGGAEDSVARATATSMGTNNTDDPPSPTLSPSPSPNTGPADLSPGEGHTRLEQQQRRLRMQEDVLDAQDAERHETLAAQSSATPTGVANGATVAGASVPVVTEASMSAARPGGSGVSDSSATTAGGPTVATRETVKNEPAIGASTALHASVPYGDTPSPARHSTLSQVSAGGAYASIVPTTISVVHRRTKADVLGSSSSAANAGGHAASTSRTALGTAISSTTRVANARALTPSAAAAARPGAARPGSATRTTPVRTASASGAGPRITPRTTPRGATPTGVVARASPVARATPTRRPLTSTTAMTRTASASSAHSATRVGPSTPRTGLAGSSSALRPTTPTAGTASAQRRGASGTRAPGATSSIVPRCAGVTRPAAADRPRIANALSAGTGAASRVGGIGVGGASGATTGTSTTVSMRRGGPVRTTPTTTTRTVSPNVAPRVGGGLSSAGPSPANRRVSPTVRTSALGTSGAGGASSVGLARSASNPQRSSAPRQVSAPRTASANTRSNTTPTGVRALPAAARAPVAASTREPLGIRRKNLGDIRTDAAREVQVTRANVQAERRKVAALTRVPSASRAGSAPNANAATSTALAASNADGSSSGAGTPVNAPLAITRGPGTSSSGVSNALAARTRPGGAASGTTTSSIRTGPGAARSVGGATAGRTSPMVASRSASRDAPGSRVASGPSSRAASLTDRTRGAAPKSTGVSGGSSTAVPGSALSTSRREFTRSQTPNDRTATPGGGGGGAGVGAASSSPLHRTATNLSLTDSPRHGPMAAAANGTAVRSVTNRTRSPTVHRPPGVPGANMMSPRPGPAAARGRPGSLQTTPTRGAAAGTSSSSALLRGMYPGHGATVGASNAPLELSPDGTVRYVTAAAASPLSASALMSPGHTSSGTSAARFVSPKKKGLDRSAAAAHLSRQLSASRPGAVTAAMAGRRPESPAFVSGRTSPRTAANATPTRSVINRTSTPPRAATAASNAGSRVLQRAASDAKPGLGGGAGAGAGRAPSTSSTGTPRRASSQQKDSQGPPSPVAISDRLNSAQLSAATVTRVPGRGAALGAPATRRQLDV